jgi:hypothetical protein
VKPAALVRHPMRMQLERKHPLAIRWFHWINFPLLALMIWSGILIYWAYPAYAPVKLEQSTWRALHVNNRLAEGMALHFFFMWLFGVNGVLYVLYTLFSGEWRELVPRKGTLHEAWNVVLHDLRIRKEPLPRKFNGAQQSRHDRHRHGRGLAAQRARDLQAVQFVWLVWLSADTRRAVRPLLADRRVCRVLPRPHRAGRARGVEQLPGDGHRCGGDA